MELNPILLLRYGAKTYFMGEMGMYTELVLGVDLKHDTPTSVIEVLRYMLGEIETKPTLPEHALFKTDRWAVMLRMGGYYFSGPTNSVLRLDSTTKEWGLSVRCNLKNYGSEIEKFCDWIRPYINDPQPGEFMGYSRYEECEKPELLFV